MNTLPQIGQRVVCETAWGKVAGSIVKVNRGDFSANIQLDRKPVRWPFKSRILAIHITRMKSLTGI